MDLFLIFVYNVYPLDLAFHEYSLAECTYPKRHICVGKRVAD